MSICLINKISYIYTHMHTSLCMQSAVVWFTQDSPVRQLFLTNRIGWNLGVSTFMPGKKGNGWGNTEVRKN